MNDYYDVLIKKVNKNKYKVHVDWRDVGWKNKDYIGKIVFAHTVNEWWFVPNKGDLLGAKELKVIAKKIIKLETRIKKCISD